MTNRQPTVELRPFDIRPNHGALYFTVTNKQAAYDFMVKIEKCRDCVASIGERMTAHAFRWERLEKFLAFAAAQGVVVERP